MSRFANPDEEPNNYSTWQIIRDTWRLLKGRRGRFIVASLIRASTDIVWLYPTYALATLVNMLGQSIDQATVWPRVWHILVLWGLAVVWRAVGIYLARVIYFRVTEETVIGSNLKAIRHLFNIDIAWHEKENSGNKIKRIQTGSSSFGALLRMWLQNLIEISVNFVGMIFILAKFDTFVGLLMAGFIVSYFALSHVFAKWVARASYRVSAQEERLSGLQFQAISNIRTVKLMSIAAPLYATIKSEATELLTRFVTRTLRTQSRQGILFLWSHIVRTAVLIYILFGIFDGRYEVGFLVLFSAYFGTVWGSVAELSDVSQGVIIARYAVMRMNHVLEIPVTIDNDEGKALMPSGWNTIKLADVSFGYGDNAVLNNVSFEIRRGEKVGIVGLSGAGKSTLFKLLLKEYENFTGSITFDGTTIQNIQKTDYFRHVAVVLQDTEVFNFSLKDNVTIANDLQKDNVALLNKSLSIAHVTDFLPKLPHGVDTVIGEKGVKLSGGEKQRLGIARAVFKQPQLLLLDEATSHLDLESEEKIKDSLHKFFENVTAIVIAHRLTTIREMDKILVIEEGRLIEQGSFDELYEKRGRFYELWEKQKL